MIVGDWLPGGGIKGKLSLYMENPDDTTVLSDLRRQEENAYRILYRFHYPMVERFVLRNSGSQDDAKDVFQDTLVVLLRKVNDDFELTSSLKTYVFAISSNLWLKRLAKARQNFDLYFDSVQDVESHNALSALVEEDQRQARQARLSDWLGKITEHCKTFLQAVFFLGKKAEEMGYKNKHVAQNQQYKCLQQIRKVVDTPESGN